MGLDERLKRLERAASIGDAHDSICKCPDAFVLVGTPDARTCATCGKAINISTWKNWRLILPTPEHNYFAFGLQRDDNYRSGTR
jgi:hypothetical protein